MARGKQSASTPNSHMPEAFAVTLGSGAPPPLPLPLGKRMRHAG